MPFVAFLLSQYILGPLLFLLSVFIVLVILLQRGRGGGLTGALGGAGGSSAFGVKAGDIFTRITGISVLLWIVLCAFTCWYYLPDSLDSLEVDSDALSTASGGALTIQPNDNPANSNSEAATLPAAPAVTLPPVANAPATETTSPEATSPAPDETPTPAETSSAPVEATPTTTTTGAAPTEPPSSEAVPLESAEVPK